MGWALPRGGALCRRGGALAGGAGLCAGGAGLCAGGAGCLEMQDPSCLSLELRADAACAPSPGWLSRALLEPVRWCRRPRYWGAVRGPQVGIPLEVPWWQEQLGSQEQGLWSRLEHVLPSGRRPHYSCLVGAL